MSRILTSLLYLNFLVGTSLYALPDISGEFRVNGVPRAVGEFFEIPLSGSVRNGGNDLAGRFKISGEYSLSSLFDPKAAPLRAIEPGTQFRIESFYAWTEFAMPVGLQRRFTVKLLVPRKLTGRTIALRLLFDSCTGEEFMPHFCRVDEDRENNNFSATRTLTLP
jgi:hypothetical protein